MNIRTYGLIPGTRTKVHCFGWWAKFQRDTARGNALSKDLNFIRLIGASFWQLHKNERAEAKQEKSKNQDSTFFHLLPPSA